MMFKCEVCSLIVDEKKPATCPECKSTDFVKLDTAKEETISDARGENDLLMELSGMVTNCIEMALELKDNSVDNSIDPLISKVLSTFPEVRAMVYNQLAKNMKKERWG